MAREFSVQGMGDAYPCYKWITLIVKQADLILSLSELAYTRLSVVQTAPMQTWYIALQSLPGGNLSLRFIVWMS